MQHFSVEEYNNLLERVVEWNKVVVNTDKELQREVTLEEVDEAIKDINEGNDAQSIMFELADVFVTAGYLNFLHTQAYVSEFVVDDDIEPINILSSIRGSVKTRNVPFHTDIQKLFYWASVRFGEHNMLDAVVRKLESNESKFVPEHLWDRLSEIDRANVEYASKGYKNIMGVKRSFLGAPVWLLRADRGEGKVLKPSTFKKP